VMSGPQAAGRREDSVAGHICLGTATLSIMSLCAGIPEIVTSSITTRVHVHASVPRDCLEFPEGANSPAETAPEDLYEAIHKQNNGRFIDTMSEESTCGSGSDISDTEGDDAIATTLDMREDREHTTNPRHSRSRPSTIALRRMQARNTFAGNSMMFVASEARKPSSASLLSGMTLPSTELTAEMASLGPVSEGGEKPVSVRKRSLSIDALNDSLDGIPRSAQKLESPTLVRVRSRSQMARKEERLPGTPSVLTPPEREPPSVATTVNTHSSLSGGLKEVLPTPTPDYTIDEYVDIETGKVSVELYYWPNATKVFVPDKYKRKLERRARRQASASIVDIPPVEKSEPDDT
jgi:hypothetical protein